MGSPKRRVHRVLEVEVTFGDDRPDRRIHQRKFEGVEVELVEC